MPQRHTIFDGDSHMRYGGVMARPFTNLLVLFSIVTVLALSSCSAVQEVRIQESGSGQADIQVDLTEPFAAYLVDLMGSLDGSTTSVFDVESIERSFEDQSGLRLQSVQLVADTTLELSVAFDSISDLMRGQGGRVSRMLRFERADGFYRLAADLDRRSVQRALELAGIDSELAEYVLPPEGSMSPEEYGDYLMWALEEYASSDTFLQDIQESTIQTTVTVPGPVLQQTGGYSLGNRVRYQTPVLQLLTTNVPMRYSVVFTAGE